MAVSISVTTITNTSTQAIPVLVSATTSAKASASSNLAYSVERQISIAPGASLTVETSRLDLGQLDAIRKKNLISYSST